MEMNEYEQDMDFQLDVLQPDQSKKKKMTFMERQAKKLLKLFKQEQSKLFNAKTVHCNHHLGCFTEIIKQSAKAYMFAFVIKCAIKTLLRLPRILRSPKLIFRVLTNKFNYKYAAFPALFVFLFKGILCLQRHLIGDHKTNVVIAGFLASFFSLS